MTSLINLKVRLGFTNMLDVNTYSGGTYLSNHVVSHGVLLWGGQQGGLGRDLGLRLL